jgi:hypothetical protein
MSVKFQVHLPKQEHITTPDKVILVWTTIATCEMVFPNCDAANILTRAGISDYTELTQRHKMNALYFILLSSYFDRNQRFTDTRPTYSFILCYYILQAISNVQVADT